MAALPNTPVRFTPNAVPFAIRAERVADVVAREALLDACFGANREMRTCQRLREGRAPAEGLALSVVRQGKLVGTVRLWHVSAGGVPALMLGPLAVDDRCRKLGIGAALMDRALTVARQQGHGAVILLGDSPRRPKPGLHVRCRARPEPRRRRDRPRNRSRRDISLAVR